jgi:hypothetical protein
LTGLSADVDQISKVYDNLSLGPGAPLDMDDFENLISKFGDVSFVDQQLAAASPAAQQVSAPGPLCSS